MRAQRKRSASSAPVRLGLAERLTAVMQSRVMRARATKPIQKKVGVGEKVRLEMEKLKCAGWVFDRVLGEPRI